MVRLKLTLDDAEFAKLLDLARQELRYPESQALHIIRAALAHRERLIQAQPADADGQEAGGNVAAGR